MWSGRIKAQGNVFYLPAGISCGVSGCWGCWESQLSVDWQQLVHGLRMRGRRASGWWWWWWWVCVGGWMWWAHERRSVGGWLCVCVCVWRCASGGNISQELICIMWSDSLFRPVIASQSFTAAPSRATTPNQIISPCRVRAALFRRPSSISFYYLRIKWLHVYQIVDEESSVDSAVTFMCSSSAAAVWQTQLATRWWWKWSIQQQKSRVWFRHKTGIITEWKSGFLMMIMFL